MSPAAPTTARSKRLRAIALGLLGALAVVGVLFAAAVYKPIHRRAGSAVAAAIAPDLTLADATGATTSLGALTARGPAVLVFYRGFW